MKRQLAESFKALLCQMPIEKIKIKDITDKAGVIRTTFYNHYQDKYDILEWIIYEDLLKPAMPLIENGLFNEALVLIFTCLEKERTFYKRAILVEGQNSFEKIAEKCCVELLKGVIDARGQGKNREYKWLSNDMIASYYAKTMVYIVLIWIKDNSNVSAREMSNVYDFIIHHSMEEALQEIYDFQI